MESPQYLPVIFLLVFFFYFCQFIFLPVIFLLADFCFCEFTFLPVNFLLVFLHVFYFWIGQTCVTYGLFRSEC